MEKLDEFENRKNVFKLTDTSGATLARTDNFYVQAESEDSARLWIKTIKELLDRIRSAQKKKAKIAVTQGAKMFLDLPTKHKGVLFRNDEEHIGKIFVELHGDDTGLSALILYDEEGDKLCDSCLELANAVTRIACDSLSLSIQLESGAKYVFRTVEEDAETGSAVIGEWGLKLKESGCKLVEERRQSRVEQVRGVRARFLFFTRSHHQKIARKSTLECGLICDINQRSNTGTTEPLTFHRIVGFHRFGNIKTQHEW